MSAITVTSIASWYGSNRMLAPRVGKELDGCDFVGVVFAGGLSELPHIRARSLLVNDRHRHLINLARVAGHNAFGPKLYRWLRRTPYHPDELADAQERCRAREAAQGMKLFPADGDGGGWDEALEWARDYFVCAWMVRHGNAGTPSEFKGGIGMRYDAGGGDNGTHFRNAVRSLIAWRREVLWRCNFTTFDFREFLDRCCKDEAGHGYYSDSPFPGPGEKYTHRFTMQDHRDLASRLSSYRKARVVVRFYDHPTIRDLYPADRWTWIRLEGRKQTNEAAPEVLLINGPSYAKTQVA